jgi:hypothetical protein
MSAIPPRLRRLDYGAVVPRSPSTDAVLKQMAGALGKEVRFSGDTILHGVLIPSKASGEKYLISFHFDLAGNRSSRAKATKTKTKAKTGDVILWHGHLSSQPSTKPPENLVKFRDRGIDVAWLFEKLDGMFSPTTRVFIDAELSADSFVVPPAIEAARLVAPPLEGGQSGKLSLVGASYRTADVPLGGGLREFGWSSDESGQHELKVSYIENWDPKVRNPWKYQAEHAVEYLSKLR